MKQIEGSETSDKGLGFTGNRDPEIQLWGERFAGRGQWCCLHEKGGSRRESGRECSPVCKVGGGRRVRERKAYSGTIP